MLPAGIFNRFITATMLRLYRFMAKVAPALVCHMEDYARHSSYLSPYLEKVAVIPPAPRQGEGVENQEATSRP